ncbi:MAG: hypothetical protein KME59_21465 [Trichormus sp. ATA11-4-KO1]|jgi:hypothetical protein|nr:hypothetical protein [Trichormus sp. ATA11-4-KO1]
MTRNNENDTNWGQLPLDIRGAVQAAKKDKNKVAKLHQIWDKYADLTTLNENRGNTKKVRFYKQCLWWIKHYIEVVVPACHRLAAASKFYQTETREITRQATLVRYGGYENGKLKPGLSEYVSFHITEKLHNLAKVRHHIQELCKKIYPDSKSNTPHCGYLNIHGEVWMAYVSQWGNKPRMFEFKDTQWMLK